MKIESILKIVIPLASTDGGHHDELICYIKILNFPYFFVNTDVLGSSDFVEKTTRYWAIRSSSFTF